MSIVKEVIRRIQMYDPLKRYTNLEVIDMIPSEENSNLYVISEENKNDRYNYIDNILKSEINVINNFYEKVKEICESDMAPITKIEEIKKEVLKWT